ncbi:MAG: AAA family ATPase [Parcubacteria group bacterium]|nr:AAA family ATPase [Parcubacteria group bacterium]
MDNKLIVIIGIPGSGKSTLGKKIAELKGYTFYDMDDTMPEHMKNKMRNKELVSEEERGAYTKVWLKDFRKLLKNNSVVASMVIPRERQREMVYENFPNAIFINLDIPLEVLKQRLQNRKDHFFSIETLEKAFNNNEKILIKHFDVDATQSINNVTDDILKLI